MRFSNPTTAITLSVAALFLAGSPDAAAKTYVMRYDALLTGVLNGAPFQNRPLVITGTYDTADVAPFPIFPDTVLYAPLSDVQFDISGVGTVAFQVPTAIFSNSAGAAGWTRLQGNDGDLIDIVNPFFETWDMDSPVARTFAFSQSTFGSFSNLPTSGGPITFGEIYDVYFQVVPEPSTLAMLLAALPLGYLACRQRR
jgi:hypothetical protein